MNYTLHVLKGRSQVGAIRLIDGVNSIGRHDDCVIRIRSSQVSRRHCELFEADGSLIVRDLGSSNGTFVNGDRIEAPRVLHPGDALTIGGVTLRIDAADAEAEARKERDTAELEVLADAEAAEEVVEADDFDLDFETDATSADPTDDIDVLELMMDESPADAPAAEAEAPKAKTKAKKSKKPKKAKAKETKKPAEDEGYQLAGDEGGSEEDDAVAQFLMDLKIDDDE